LLNKATKVHAIIKMELKCAGEELVVPAVLPAVLPSVGFVVEMISVVISGEELDVPAVLPSVGCVVEMTSVVISGEELDVPAVLPSVGFVVEMTSGVVPSVRCVGSKFCNIGPRSGSSEKTISSMCSNRSNTTICNKITCDELN
jgi:hypothetical protein